MNKKLSSLASLALLVTGLAVTATGIASMLRQIFAQSPGAGWGPALVGLGLCGWIAGVIVVRRRR
jgi:hypothetical protein